MSIELDTNRIQSMSIAELHAEIDRGGRFVVFEYRISFCVATFGGWSRVYFLREGESTASASRLYNILSLLFGWWAWPVGILHTLAAISLNLGGGKDVTVDVMEKLGIPLGPAPALQTHHPYRLPAPNDTPTPAAEPQRDEWDDKLDEELRRL